MAEKKETRLEDSNGLGAGAHESEQVAGAEDSFWSLDQNDQSISLFFTCVYGIRRVKRTEDD
eukprot:1609182-Pleurochrysis_carterae.AAC.3